MIAYAGENARMWHKENLSCISGGNINFDSHFRNQDGDFSKNQESTYFKTQQYYS